MTTVLEAIDAALVEARTRWLKATWAGDLPEIAIADADLDTLLGQRRDLTNPTPSETADRG